MYSRGINPELPQIRCCENRNLFQIAYEFAYQYVSSGEWQYNRFSPNHYLKKNRSLSNVCQQTDNFLHVIIIAFNVAEVFWVLMPIENQTSESLLRSIFWLKNTKTVTLISFKIT